MKTPIWIFQNIFEETQKAFEECLFNRDIVYYIFSNYTELSDILNSLPKDSIIIPRCSVEYYNIILDKFDNIGYYCYPFEPITTFDCSYYYPFLGQHLLNDDYEMLPFGELKRKMARLFSLYGKNVKGIPHIFVRPNSGNKSFSGQLVDEKFLGVMDNVYDCQPDEIVVVSSPKRVEDEMRLVVVDGKVVGGSTYSHNTDEEHKEVNIGGTKYRESILDHSVQEFINSYKYMKFGHLNRYNNIPYILDICNYGMPPGAFSFVPHYNYRVVELNSFNCAGLYASDISKIVVAIQEHAVKYWRELYE